MTCSALERTRSSPERPSSSANSRNTSSPNPWKVLIAASFNPSGVLRSTRSCIPAAAFSVKVTARIWCGLAAPDAMRCTTRAVSTCVLPVPAPATMRSGPAPCSTARRCSPVSPPRMSGFGSPSPKASCSVIRGVAGGSPPAISRVEALRSFVLFYREALGESHERSDRGALWPARRIGTVLVGPVDASDVQMRPLRVAFDHGPEERRGLDRTALAAGAVPDVGDLALDLVLVFVGERQRPHPVARRGCHAAHGLDEEIGRAECRDGVCRGAVVGE